MCHSDTLFGITALGLFVFGVFQLIVAYYRRLVRLPFPDQRPTCMLPCARTKKRGKKR